MRQYNFYTYILTNFNKTVLYTGDYMSIILALIKRKVSQVNTNAFTWFGTNDINMLIMPLKEKRKLKVG